LCRERNRRIERIDAIAYHSGALQDKIHSFKYEGKAGWSLIFGRLLVGWLEAHARDDPPGIIVANPTHLGPASQALDTSRRLSGRPLHLTMTGAGSSTAAPLRRSSRHGQRKSRPERTLLRSGRPQQPSAKSWISPTLPEQKGAMSSCSTTCAPPDTSSTPSPTACSTMARRPESVPWSWHEHPGGERSVDARASAKKCYETQTEPVWPQVRQPRTRRSHMINMSRQLIEALGWWLGTPADALTRVKQGPPVQPPGE